MQAMGGALVSCRILEEVELVVVLRIPPLARSRNLSGDLLANGCKVLLLDLFCHASGNLLLFFRVVEDGRPVFWNDARSDAAS